MAPQPGPQETFLATPADIAIYGGAAYGGKSWALCYEPLRHVDNPGFGAVIFRRTAPQITNEGGLWDEAGKIYPLADAEPRVGTLDWIFPSGANVGFRHLQHEANKYDWQGTQVPLIGFDELTHFTESQFFYLISRNRSTCGVRPYIRATTNPDAGSWVKRFLAPWVDRKSPIRAASGELLWFVREDGKIVWGRTQAELKARRPDLVPKSVTFIKATIWDNKIGMALDPGYLGNLQAQTPVEKARLLDGDWDVVNEGLVYPDFGRCVVEPEDWPAKLAGEAVGGIDWGFNNPFAALGATLDRDDVLWVGWERYGSRQTLSEHARALPRGVRWWADPAGADQVAELRAGGHDVVPCVHLGGGRSASGETAGPLRSGIAQVTERIRSGRLRVQGGLGHLIGEAGQYRYEGRTEKPIDRDNHALAALRYLVVGLDRGKAVTRRQPHAEVAAAEAAEAAEAAARAEYYSIDNDQWWQS